MKVRTTLVTKHKPNFSIFQLPDLLAADLSPFWLTAYPLSSHTNWDMCIYADTYVRT